MAIDQSNPLNWYVSTAAGVNIRQCGMAAALRGGGLCRRADDRVCAGRQRRCFADRCALAAGPGADQRMSSIGTCRVWRGPAANGAAWSGSNAISATLGGGAERIVRRVRIRWCGRWLRAGRRAVRRRRRMRDRRCCMRGWRERWMAAEILAGTCLSITTAKTAGSDDGVDDLAKSPVTNGGGCAWVQSGRLRCLVARGGPA